MVVFQREAQKIAGNSVRYLKTEYNTVVAGAQMSRKWQEIQRDKHLFPYVMFDVVNDKHTSDICRPLHNVIVTADDPMLMYYFPPNHFNCRTDVRRLRYGRPTEKYNLPDIPEAFKNNVGMSGKIFTDKNRYIENTPKETLSLADKIQLKEQRNSIKSWAKEHLLDKKVKHSSLEKEIGFSVTGIKEALNQPHKHLMLKNEAIKNIEELIKSAEYIGSSNDNKGRTTIYHYLKIYIAGEESFIVLKENGNGVYFYTITDKIKGF